jgi:hypothetical protein
MKDFFLLNLDFKEGEENQGKDITIEMLFVLE